MVQKLKLKTYKVPYTIGPNKEVIEDISIPLTKRELISEEEIEIEEISTELIPLSQKVAQYNARQVKYAEAGQSSDYIKKRIITK